MIPFKFNCPICHNEITVESKYKGSVGQCPYCENSVKIPLYSTSSFTTGNSSNSSNSSNHNKQNKQKRKWTTFENSGVKFLFMLKILLFVISCTFMYLVYDIYDTKLLSNPGNLSKIKGESVKSINPSDSLLGIDTTRDHIEASGENTQSMLKNSNKIVSLNTVAIKQNDCITRLLIYISFAFFCLLLSCFIDKIFSVE